MMLFAMLVVVVVLMQEAGKPERWLWMGFELPVPEQPRAEDLVVADLSPPDVSGEFTDTASPVPRAALTRLRDGQRKPVETAPVMMASNGSPELPIATKIFWTDTWQAMTIDQKKLLLGLLRQSRHPDEPSPETKEPREGLLEWIEQRKANAETRLLNQIALLAEASEEKKERLDELYQFQTRFNETTRPALQHLVAGEDITLKQQQQLANLQLLLDPLILKDVEDFSAVGSTNDSVAWMRMWEQIRDEKMSPTNVAMIQLMAQPKAWRGQAVRIAGQLRTARYRELANSTIGLPGWYELWLTPQGDAESLACVYAINKPASFPELDGRHRAFDRPVSVSGRFFKIRSYRSAEGGVDHCPLVLAADFEWQPPTASSTPSNTMSTFSPLVIGAVLAIISVIAVAIACAVYRASRQQTYRPRGKVDDHIGQSLDALGQNPGIQTPAERIRELYDES